jgi:probable DNA repair protein
MAALTISELLDQVTSGATVLLPSPRAAAELRAAYEAQQRASGHPAWEPPAAWSWSQWLRGLWGELIVNGTEQRLLLNPAQELALWREIVAEPLTGADATEAALGSPDALATLAYDAWQLAARYEATGRLRAAANSHDTRIFAAWAEAFTRRCASAGYLSAALLEQAIREHLEARSLTPPATLLLAGWLDESPAQRSLLEALAARGCEVDRVVLTHEQTNTAALRGWTVAASEQEELTLAARWVRAFVEDRQRKGQSARVGILLPQPAEDRAALEAALLNELAPELNAIDADLSGAPWEFSSGPSLASLPMVATALGLAQWAAHPLPIDAITALVLSPYLGGNAQQREASARVDATVRRTSMLRDELTLPQFLTLAGRGDETPAIVDSLRDVAATLQRNGDLQRPRGYAEWGEFLRDLLRAANWPGDRAPNPTEFEAARAWDSLLDTLATLDFQGRRVPYAAFLDELQRQAEATAFAPPATHAPVQVMTAHEAEGCLFDAVVLLRATDANWPTGEHTNPLLPWPLQRTLQMPGTDPIAANTRARTAAQDLFARSGSVLCTLAAENADGPLRPSPLLSALPLTPIAADELLPAAHPTVPIELEAIPDDAPLPPLPSREVHGGARVLKLQAACGFLAFAEVRLRASEPDSPELGLDAGESGNFLHDALQRFWQEVHSQEVLRAMSPNERSEMLAACIDDALPRRLRAESAWDEAYLAMQKQRLLTVLEAWLDIELQRAPFEVRAFEAKQQVEIGPLTLDVRLDRIDRVADEGFLLVDYKSGNAGHPREWETGRPLDPQLPLYALLHEPHELKGLAFAKVRAGKEMRWLGVQAEDGLLPRSRTNVTIEMEGQLAVWRDTLTRLAEDFAEGRADVSPRDFHKDCAHCIQRLLCRVDPMALATHEDASTGEEIDG